MRNRYEKIVLEAEEGITFVVSEETSGELSIKSMNITSVDRVSGNYANPPILEGYKHVCGEWNNGFVIERCSDGSQFVWIPVGSLDSNGTLDGVSFSEKFGRRNYQKKEFSEEEYHEALLNELSDQFESVKKYGGFYISRYNISKNSEGNPQSVEGVMPWVNINFYTARKVAASIEDSRTVKSHLPFGAEYDSALEWFINSKAETLKEVVNVKEWTQERYGSSYRVIRGGDFHDLGHNYPAAYRSYDNPFKGYSLTGFRAVLCIK